MKDQITLTDVEYGNRKKTTKREEFLNKMEEIIPWKAWVEMIRPYYPKGVESEQGAARTGWEDAREIYFRSRMEGENAYRGIHQLAFKYETVDHNGDPIDHRRFGDFKHGDLSSDEIRGFFMDERQESNLSESYRAFGAGGADGRHSCGVQACQDLSL